MGETGSLLSLDPAVLFLQIVAFVILFLVLRRYLFRPLLNVIEQRESEISDALEAGEKARAELERIDQERERVLTGAREEGRQQVRAAVQEGERARNRILSEARGEAQQLRERARETVDLERREAALQLRREVVDLALLAAQRAVLTQLDEEKHRRAIDDFIAGLEQRQ
ncbi:MAG TPA: F0F1 ATP synthase subunit B [Armatimonadota bacterium]|nr:F0F1 ATP synthase subunit B [Armatimonadota bacterium]